ncbi:MAG TPA: nucleoside deaminase [Mycobacteriales bacterium]|jgi:tRNA(Arg) A34 adenosine deaminase TadA
MDDWRDGSDEFFPDARWRRPFELAWESLQAGSFPVGAVLFDPAGAVAAEGRNRIAEQDAPAGQLRGTSLAHAEVNVLAQMPPHTPPAGHYDYLLYTTLEPCLLCTSALRMTRVGRVLFAAPDEYWAGVAGIPQLLRSGTARHWTARYGPIAGPLGVWAGVLPAYWYLTYRPSAVFTADPVVPKPRVDLADRLRDADVFQAKTTELALQQAWPDLARVAEGG